MKSRFVSLSLSLVMVLTACESQNVTKVPRSQPKVETLSWVHHFDEEGARKWLEIGTQLFSKQHPSYTFALTGVDGGNYLSLLRTRAISGNMPDMYMIDNLDTAIDFIRSGYAMDLSNQPSLAHIDERYLGGVKTADGRIWALPIDVNGVGVIYNKDAFAKADIKEPPKTWQQFIEACEALQKVGIVPIAAGYKDAWTISWDLAADMLANQYVANPTWIADIEAGKTTFKDNQIQFKEILQRFGERLKYVNKKPFETDWNQAQMLLADGEAGMIINGTWTVDGVKSKNPTSNLGLFAFPYSSDPQKAIFGLKSTGGIVVNPKSPHKDRPYKHWSCLLRNKWVTFFRRIRKRYLLSKGYPKILIRPISN